jgi:predicted acyl esterase
MSEKNSSSCSAAADGMTAGDLDFEIVYSAQQPFDSPMCRYPGLRPGKTVLPKGYTYEEGRMPFATETVFESDVAIKLRDGTTLYADIYRPVGEEKAPAILSWGSYGKRGHNNLLDQISMLFEMDGGSDIPYRMGVPRNATSGMQAWESPDPAHWVPFGYAVVNVDARGSYMSEGDMHFFGPQEGRDGYDAVEWIASQDWCNGRVAMNGNSWYGMTQWTIAAERPPHLAAIAPWEAETNIYRDEYVRDGIPVILNKLVSRSFGSNRVEDMAAMVEKYPLMSAYWESKIAKLENIEIPIYLVAGYNSQMHTRGTLEAYHQIGSKEKWLRVHNTQEWPDLYDDKHRADLRRFFDRYLKGVDNGWESTPCVRLSVFDPGGLDVVNRVETDFPLTRQQPCRLYLDATNARLSTTPATRQSKVSYNTDAKESAAFTIRFDQETEITGFITLRLWVEADGADDMDLFARIVKLDKNGQPLFQNSLCYKYSGPDGRLRVSHRQLDPERSTPFQPCHTHKTVEPLRAGEIVPVEIQIWPTGLLFHPGQQLQLAVAGYDYALSWPGDRPKADIRNTGSHILHTGGRYDSYLLVPVIPQQSHGQS